MTTARASRVAARCLAFAFAAAFALEAAAQAGTVRALEGLAYVRTAAAARVALKPGSSIEAGSSIIAGPDAAMELELADGQVLGLGSETNARIDSFRFDSGNPAASALEVALVEGAMRFVGGTIARTRPQAVRAAGAGAQVGVLGGDQVDFTLVVESAALKSGALHVTSGQVALTAPSGAQQVLNSGQSARWKGEGEATVMPLSAMPAELAARINSVQAAAALISALPAPGAGAAAVPAPPPLPPVAVTPGGGGGCVGSPC
ncbi:MAG: hypothetical protein AB7O64_19805 [Methylibium sp.]